MKNLKMIASMGLFAALAAGTAAYAQSAPASGSKQSEKQSEKKKEKKAEKHADHAKVGAAAPAFTLKDSAGKDVSLADFKGKVVVL